MSEDMLRRQRQLHENLLEHAGDEHAEDRREVLLGSERLERHDENVLANRLRGGQPDVDVEPPADGEQIARQQRDAELHDAPANEKFFARLARQRRERKAQEAAIRQNRFLDSRYTTSKTAELDAQIDQILRSNELNSAYAQQWFDNHSDIHGVDLRQMTSYLKHIETDKRGVVTRLGRRNQQWNAAFIQRSQSESFGQMLPDLCESLLETRFDRRLFNPSYGIKHYVELKTNLARIMEVGKLFPLPEFALLPQETQRKLRRITSFQTIVSTYIQSLSVSNGVNTDRQLTKHDKNELTNRKYEDTRQIMLMTNAAVYRDSRFTSDMKNADCMRLAGEDASRMVDEIQRDLDGGIDG